MRTLMTPFGTLFMWANLQEKCWIIFKYNSFDILGNAFFSPFANTWMVGYHSHICRTIMKISPVDG